MNLYRNLYPRKSAGTGLLCTDALTSCRSSTSSSARSRTRTWDPLINRRERNPAHVCLSVTNRRLGPLIVCGNVTTCDAHRYPNLYRLPIPRNSTPAPLRKGGCLMPVIDLSGLERLQAAIRMIELNATLEAQ